jgi:hypothetical protein
LAEHARHLGHRGARRVKHHLPPLLVFALLIRAPFLDEPLQVAEIDHYAPGGTVGCQGCPALPGGGRDWCPVPSDGGRGQRSVPPGGCWGRRSAAPGHSCTSRRRPAPTPCESMAVVARVEETEQKFHIQSEARGAFWSAHVSKMI